MTDIMLETLGISVFTSSAFILIIIILRAMFRRKISMRLQYALWFLVVVKLILIPIPRVSSPVSVMNLTDNVYLQEVRLQISDSKAISPVDEEQQVLEENIAQNFDADINDKQINVIIDSKVNVAKLLLIVAGCGSIFMFLYFVVYNLKFAVFLHKRRMRFEGYNAKLPIYLVEGLPSPCLYGKAIYITAEVTVDEKKLSHVIVHEYCHYRQGDLLWSALRSLCIICYWWNPLVWLAAYLAKQDCELACDEAALKQLGEEERIFYGETLISLITLKTKTQDYFSVATTMKGGRRSMKHRIRRIALNQKVIIPVCFLLVCIVGICFVSISTAKDKTKDKTKEEISVSKELTMQMVIEMFTDGRIETVDYFSFENAEIEDKEEVKSNGVLNYYVDYSLTYKGEDYNLGVSYNVENDALEAVYLTRKSDMDSRLIYSSDSDNSVVKDLEEFLNHKMKLSDILTIELPAGYTLSDYRADIGVNGGVLIEPQAYQVMKGLDSDYGSGVTEWLYSGTISVIKYPKDWFVFENGKPVDKMIHYWNHTVEEKVEILEGFDMPAILYQASHDLYTAAETEILSEQGIQLTDDELTSDYWYIYFVSQDKEEAYYLSLDQKQFTKEEAVEIAKTVKFAK